MRREQAVQKLKDILTAEWPDKNVNVSIFGSSGNLLFTNSSDGMLVVGIADESESANPRSRRLCFDFEFGNSVPTRRGARKKCAIMKLSLWNPVLMMNRRHEEDHVRAREGGADC